MTTTQAAYVAPTNRPEMTERDCILALLRDFAEQRPGLEFGNYGDVAAFRSESRSITKDLHQARALLRYVEMHPSISAEYLREGFRAFSGRLTYDPAKRSLDYCTGQYWPTEYRRAVCAVLASAVWSWLREDCMPAPDGQDAHGSPRYQGMGAGDYLRKAARRELGAVIQKRWLD